MYFTQYIIYISVETRTYFSEQKTTDNIFLIIFESQFNNNEHLLTIDEFSYFVNRISCLYFISSR